MDPYFQLTEQTLRLPGVDRPYRVLHISDLHLMEADDLCTEEEKALAVKENKHWEEGALYFAAEFGDDTSPVHRPGQKGILRRFLKLANELKPDALLLTGDTLEYYSAPNIRYLREALKEAAVPTVTVRGNHEFDAHEEWPEFFPCEDEVRVTRVGKLKFLTIDDHQRKVSAKALACLQREAAEPGIVPILLYHIPVWTEDQAALWTKIGEYYTVSPQGADEPTAEFLRWLACPECPIHLCLCGHIHGRSESHISASLTQLTATSAMLGGGNLLTIEG